MKKLQVAIFAVVMLAALTSVAQDMSWPMRTTETVSTAPAGGRGGRRGGPMMQNNAPEQTRERMVTVLVKMIKVTGGEVDIISFKPTPPRGKSPTDVTQVSIPFADKETLTEALKKTIADLKKPTKANESEIRKIYADSAGKFTATLKRDGHKKHLEVIFKDGNAPNVFELSIQQVEVFHNALRNIK